MMEDNADKYSDIINLPNPTSKTHKRMSIMNRAAQFAPFAALTGYGEAIHEAERETNEKIELDDNKRQMLDEQILFIIENINEKPAAKITYFVPDDNKDGGEYVTVEGIVKKIDYYAKAVFMENGKKIYIEDVIDIQCDKYSEYDKWS